MATEFEPRRAKPGETFEYADTEGTLHRFSADDDGVVYPSDAMEVAVLDGRSTPVARKVMAEQKAEATPARAEKEK